MMMIITGGRYIVTSGNVDLCMRTVRPDDATKKFSCLATNTLTGERKLSEVVTLSIKGLYTQQQQQQLVLKRKEKEAM